MFLGALRSWPDEPYTLHYWVRHVLEASVDCVPLPVPLLPKPALRCESVTPRLPMSGHGPAVRVRAVRVLCVPPFVLQISQRGAEWFHLYLWGKRGCGWGGMLHGACGNHCPNLPLALPPGSTAPPPLTRMHTRIPSTRASAAAPPPHPHPFPRPRRCCPPPFAVAAAKDLCWMQDWYWSGLVFAGSAFVWYACPHPLVRSASRDAIVFVTARLLGWRGKGASTGRPGPLAV